MYVVVHWHVFLKLLIERPTCSQTTYHNGKELPQKTVVNLACYDRIVMGGEFMLFVDPAVSADAEEPTVESVVEEFFRAQTGMTRDMMHVEMLELFPQIKEARRLCATLNRGMLTFDARVHSRYWEATKSTTTKVLVTNTETGESIPIDAYEFSRGLSTIKDEVRKLSLAAHNNTHYESPEANDPVRQVCKRIILMTQHGIAPGVSFSCLWVVVALVPS